jgi:gamma-glutamyltranspeptidase/glutathione hydrolase
MKAIQYSAYPRVRGVTISIAMHTRSRLTGIFINVLGGAVVFFGLCTAQATEGTKFQDSVKSSQGVVASISDYSSAVGIDVLNRGGNAVDAAVAMVFAVGVARPDYGGIGGSNFLIYRSAKGQTAALDFREISPLAMTATTLQGAGMHHDRDLGEGAVASGHRVIGVPGVVAGMDEALRRLGSGKFNLEQLITNGGDPSCPPYAYELARDGVNITFELARNLFNHQHRLQYYPATREIYSGRVYKTNLVQADYAKSLLFVAKNGADAFYKDAQFPDPVTGLPRDSIARLIVKDMQTAAADAAVNQALLARAESNRLANLSDGGDRWESANDIGLLTLADFAAYRPVWRTPLKASYRDRNVFAIPPPSSGGIATIEILNLLEGFPLNTNSFVLQGKLRDFRQSSADHLHVLAEAQKLAWADRNKYVADPDFRYDYNGDGKFEAVPTKTLTSKEYANRRRSEINLDVAKFSYKPGADGAHHTNHLSVIDRYGNAIAVTTSVGSPFGSAVVAPGTGFLLTNQLEDFNMKEPETANAAGPRKRPRSSNSPTIVLQNEKPVLVVGGAGGPTIPLGSVQAIVNTTDFLLNIAQAIDAERIEARGLGADLWIEAGEDAPGGPRVAQAVLDELTSRGHTLDTDRSEYYFVPVVEAVGFNFLTGLNEAVSDPRNETDDNPGEGAKGQ